MSVSTASDLISRLGKGDQSAADELVPLLYPELRRLASSLLRRERIGHTLQTTAVVNEAYLRLADQRNLNPEDRTQFFGLAATMIRRILVDHAKKRQSRKRGGDWERVTLSDKPALTMQDDVDVLALNAALEDLTKVSERQGRVVELRFFGGLDIGETAKVLGVSRRTVDDDWRVARARLRRSLSEAS